MAKFNYRTIDNLVTDICRDTEPIYARRGSEQEYVLAQVTSLIESDQRLKVYKSTYRDNNDPDWVKTVSVIFKDYDKDFSPMPRIRFDETGCLVLANYSKDASPVDLTTLQRVIDETFNFIDMDNADKLKKQKIRDLKTQGIVARLNEIAKEDGFKFYYHQIPTRVKLTVELPEKKLLRIDIPFSKFQEVMQQVRPFIKSSRELAATGLGFAIEKDKRN
jgi:hypothetical protein